MPQTLTISRRFNGPPDSGNGGYSCGAIASLLGSRAEVTLRSPPPLDTPLMVEEVDEGVHVMHGDVLVAEARDVALAIDLHPAVTIEEAERASRPWPADEHPFPTCFVCGPARDPGDGLRIFAGPVAGTDVLAATWTPALDLAGSDGAVEQRFVWAALDCPGGNAAYRQRGDDILLGRMHAEMCAPVSAGQPHVVVAWSLGSEGRKLFAATALYDAAGSLKAAARATWVALV